MRHVLPFFETEGADAWYTHPAEELLPPGTRCAKCGGARWRKEDDILDVWFDSGSTHLAVLDPPGQPNADLPWPADMYLEGPDQYRGWFHSSLLIAVAMRGARALPPGVDARLDARRARPADVEIARQRRAADGVLRKMGRGPAAPVGRFAGLHRRRAHVGKRA